MTKQELAARIWATANELRKNIKASEYKDYILGFIFYKYLSDKEERWLLSQDYTPEDIQEYVNEEDEETVVLEKSNMAVFLLIKSRMRQTRERIAHTFWHRL